MKEVSTFNLVAFILPLATALAGMRLSRWILGEKFAAQFGFGFRFAFGLAVGMLVFTQAVLLCALVGFNGAPLLAWAALIWGGIETVLLAIKFPVAWKSFKFQTGHLWLLLLLPLVYSWWVFGELSTLEGTLEYDANAFWVFKAKILYLEQGTDLVNVLRQSNLAYMHMDYTMLVPCLYTFGYGAVGGVDEFVNKVWPFWMMVTLCIGILSFARVWQNPRPLPIVVATLISFLPATLQFIRNEGGTIPMVFCIGLTTLLFVSAACTESEVVFPAILLACAVCFSTKLEGAVFAAFCCCGLLPFCLRRNWLKNKGVWISAAVAAASLLPYAFYRMTKPIAHPESHWMHTFTSDPGSVLHHFPQALFLNIAARFFGPQYFQWTADGDHLQWTGHWTGLGSLVNAELSVLPWLLLVFLVFSLIFKPRGRIALGILSAVILGVFTFLSFVVVCLPHWDLTQLVNLACNISGRHYYPFFVAWFLGVAALWFMDEKGPQAVQPEKKVPELQPQKPKRRA
jgi:hypothetical protein